MFASFPRERSCCDLDHVGNTLRLGHHLEHREWTLDGEQKAKREKCTSVKVCPKCFAAMSSQASECEECGHRFVVERRELKTVAGTLQELEVEKTQKKQKRIDQGKARTLDELTALGKSRGYKYPVAWARKIYSSRGSK